MAKRQAAAAVTTLEIVIPKGTPTAQELAPPTDEKALKKAQAYLQIKDDEQLAKAYEAMKWLKGRLAAIDKHPVMSRLLERAKGIVEDLTGVIKGARAPYATLEKGIRSEITRYESAREQARLRLERENRQKQLQAPAAPAGAPTSFAPPKVKEKVVETKSGDTFVFTTPAAPAAPVTIAQPEKPAETTTRKDYSAILVDPARPRDKEDSILENVPAGMEALILACAVTILKARGIRTPEHLREAGEAPLEVLMLNQRAADKLADTFKEELRVPGLAVKVVVRPVIGVGRR